MSMIGYFLAVSQTKLDELLRDPQSIGPFLAAAIEDQDELAADFLDIDKSWHGIHFVLTGSVGAGEPPLSWLVFAPTQCGEDLGNGPARILTPAEVTEVSKALSAVTADKLKRKSNCQLLNDNSVYPENWQPGDADYLAENFASLKRFYESASRRGMAVIQWRS